MITFTFPDIRYNFPEEGANPFDVNAIGKYFIDASGFSNLSRSLSAFSFDQLDKNVPTGYKLIVVCERLAIIQNANLLMENKQDDRDFINNNIAGKYTIHINQKLRSFVPSWNSYLESYSIRINEVDVSIYSHLWGTYEEAVAYAKARSCSSELVCMVSRVIDCHNWH